MKKLRCTSCNGELELDEKKEYATCNYCGTKYKLNDDLTINVKLDEDTKKALKTSAKVGTGVLAISIVPFILISLLILAIIVVSVIVGFGEVKKQQVNNFNFKFTYGSGVQPYVFVQNTLSDVNDSNKKNNHKIVVVYNDKETQDENEINEIKHSLTKYQYEVKYYYDDKGYLNKIVIEDIN